MTERWAEASDRRVEAHAYVLSPRGRRYLEGWVADVLTKRDPLTHAMFTGMQERLEAMLAAAEPIWVEDSMQTLWEAATEGFQEEPLRATDFITPAGFVSLPRPLMWTDLHGRTTCFRSILWTLARTPDGREGVALASFHRVGDVDDYDDGRLHERYRGALMPGDQQVDWFVILPFEHQLGDSEQYRRLSLIRPIQALLRLMQQTIATREREQAPKPFRRRAQKAGLPERQVVVVRLRRPDNRDPNASRDVEWSHRWLVRGHWRNQWFPSLSLHRQVWVSPFIKGPSDKELVVKQGRVWELVQ